MGEGGKENYHSNIFMNFHSHTNHNLAICQKEVFIGTLETMAFIYAAKTRCHPSIS